MTPAEAKVALQFHAFSHPDLESERAEKGFLGSLRPYKGHLIEANFHEVMQALRALASELASGEQVDRRVVSDVLTIIHFGRAWGVYPDGMLRSNGLILDQDVKKLDHWIHCIQYAVTCLLQGLEDEAFEEYREYGESDAG